MPLRFRRLSTQIPIGVGVLIVLLVTLMGVTAVAVASRELRDAAQANLDAVLRERAHGLAAAAGRLTADLHVFADDSNFPRALRTFAAMSDPASLAAAATPGSGLAAARLQYDPRFAALLREKQFHDLLLLDESGHVAYSASHRHEGEALDLAAKADPRAAAVAAALSATAPGHVGFADFDGIAPDATAWLVTPLPDVDGGWLGTLAVEIDRATVSALVDAPFGETGRVSLAAGASPPMDGRLAATVPVVVFGRDWMLGASQAFDEIDRPALRMRNAMLVVSALAMVAAIAAVCAFVILRLSRPMRALTAAMSRLAEGRLDTAVPGTARGDELGEMAQAVLVFRAAGHENLRLAAAAEAERAAATAARAAATEAAVAGERRRVLAGFADSFTRLASGDLAARVTAELPAAYAPLGRDFNRAAAALDAALSDVVTGAGTIDGEARSIAQGSEALSRRTEQQASRLEETAASLRAVIGGVGETAAAAVAAGRLVGSARAEAQAAATRIAEAVTAMERIKSTAARTEQIIGVIDEIAFQTNLLALNAGIEAARAGETGRGFAVVASEVRALAQRCADSAREVRGLVGDSRREVGDGTALVFDSGQRIEAIVARIGEVDGAMGTITEAARIQADGVTAVREALGGIETITQQNAAMTEETAAALQALVDETARLAAQAESFATSPLRRAA